MRTLLMIVGMIVAGCGVVIAIKKDRSQKDGAMEWILLIAGILIFVIGMNI